MTPRREIALFALALAAILSGFFHASLFGGKVLSPGDVVFASACFSRSAPGEDYEPANRLLMDPVLQFEPWREFARSELRAGRLPLWNPYSGCGSPLLANGQSAIFDPFQVIAYLGRLPDANSWMAAARLWVAGLGMFLLARSWGLSPRGRWLSGLSYPFCGFLMVWLLYPVASVGAWLPWLFLATDRALIGPKIQGVAGLSIVVGFVLLGGQIQTSAHLLLADGLYVLWRVFAMWRGRDPDSPDFIRPMARWSLGMALGIALAAIEIVPLATYLSKSPVWADRHAETPSALAVARPRLLDAMTTAVPYLFGSQRRGHPNLARAIGVHNLNESAGGFAGLATLVMLAPMAWGARREDPRVRFLVGLALLGGLAAFGVPPVANVLRALPILDVADNRRLSLCVAFSLCLLGGIGIDRVGLSRGGRAWTWTMMAGASLLVIAAVAVMVAAPKIRAKAIAHYDAAARETPGADPSAYRLRAERQAEAARTFLPRYYLISAGQIALLAFLRTGTNRPGTTRMAVMAMVMADLIAFGYELNPSLPRADDRPTSPAIDYLVRECPPPCRILGIGSELPPNILMRYGLADPRNYDSIELSRSLDWFAPLYDPEPDRPSHTSRRTIRWERVVESLDRLRLANVTAIVGSTPPPDGVFDRVDRVGDAWIARLRSASPRISRPSPREIQLDLDGDLGEVRSVAEMYDPAWTATIDGRPAEVIAHRGVFLAVKAPAGARLAVFRYEPSDVKVALMITLASLTMIGLVALTSVAESSRKKAMKTWTGSLPRVRIGSTFSARTPQPGSALPT